MLKKLKYLIGINFISSIAWADNKSVTVTEGASLSTIASMPNVNNYLKIVAANINWMVKMGFIFAVGMMIIHLFFNHNENIIKSAAKLVAGLGILKIAAGFISMVTV